MGRAGRRAGIALAAALLSAALIPGGASAQPTPFLFINQERLLTASRVGQALLAEEEKQRDAMRSEARALDSAFEAEEGQLTGQRPTMKAEDFRALADAFDARVVQARKDQDERASALAQEFDQRRRQFYARVAPLLVELMDRAGARAVFDANSALLIDQTLNITDEVIAAIDAQGGEAQAGGGTGAAPETAPAPVAPAPEVDSPAATPAAPAADPADGRPAPRPQGGN